MIDGYDNPWAVLSIFEFQYFNCPSCVFKTHSKKEFINHAMKVHPESIIHLSNIQDIHNGNDINSDVNIKEEPGIGKKSGYIKTRLKIGFQSKITSRVSTIGFNWILFNLIQYDSI